MANVLFKRGNTATIDGTAITDGQLLYNTTTGQHYIDSGSTRIEVGKPVVNTTAEVSAITADNIPCGTKPVKELITSLNGLNKNLTWINIYTGAIATISNINLSSYKKMRFRLLLDGKQYSHWLEYEVTKDNSGFYFTLVASSTVSLAVQFAINNYILKYLSSVTQTWTLKQFTIDIEACY